MLDDSGCEHRDLGVMADSQITAYHESLFQSQPSVRQVLHNVNEHLLPQVIPSSPLQLYGAHQFWCVLKHLHLSRS